MIGFFYKDIRKSRAIMWVIAGFTVFIAGFIISTICLSSASGDKMEESGVVVLLGVTYYLLFFLIDWALQDSYVGEDASLWQSFVMSTPGTMKAQIQSKFCLEIFMNVCVLFLCEIVDIIGCLIYGDVSVSASIFPVLFVCWNLVKASFTLPFIYGWGIKQGNIVKLMFVACVVCIAAIYGLFGDISWFLEGNVLDKIRTFFLEGNGIWILGFFPYVAAVLYYISYRICLKIYRKGLENIE